MTFSSVFTPTFTVFLLIFLGIFIGKIKIRNIQLGHAAVLGISLLLGVLIGYTSMGSVASLLPHCSFLSSLGTAIFISVIGLHAGTVFSQAKQKRLWKAFLGGCSVVLIGATTTFILLYLDPAFPTDLLLGIFAGAMTSTPTLAMVQELYGQASIGSIGYGMAYCIGVLSIALFVQFIPCPQRTTPIWEEQQTTRPISQTGTLLSLSLCVLIGSLIGWLLPIGSTGGYLLSGILFGWMSAKKEHSLSDMNLLKQLGLTMFLIGTGLPTGIQLTNGLPLRSILYGTLISISSILTGYFLLRFLFRYNTLDALSILCGGMTSTPAIGILQQKNTETDPAIYSMAYTGALITLLISIQILFYI